MDERSRAPRRHAMARRSRATAGRSRTPRHAHVLGRNGEPEAAPRKRSRGGFSPLLGMNGRGAAADSSKAMSHTVMPTGGGRGVELLLAHCDALTRLEGGRKPAMERLGRRVGSAVAQLLVSA